MEIRSVHRSMWDMFSRYHYLTQSVSSSSKFYAGFIDNEPVAIVAVNKFPHPKVKDIYKIGRIVTLPHWQGYGIGTKLTEWVAENLYADGRIRITTTLPIMHDYYYKSPKWKLTAQMETQPKLGKNAQFKTQTRQVYTETYQFINELNDNDIKITRSGVATDKVKDDRWKVRKETKVVETDVSHEQPKPSKLAKTDNVSRKKSTPIKEGRSYQTGLALAPEYYAISNDAVGDDIQLEDIDKEYYIQQVEDMLQLWFGDNWKERIERAHASRKAQGREPLEVKNYID